MMEELIRHVARLVLQDAQRTAPAIEAMEGIDIGGDGRRLTADRALVAAFLISRGEPVPKMRDLTDAFTRQ
jgi:hypothetical protein